MCLDTPCGFDRRAQGLFGGPCFFGRASMRTFVYVDGANLHHGALQGTSWKWLDRAGLCETVPQRHHDNRMVKYFTAKLLGTPANQSKRQRQDVNLRGLQRLRPEVEESSGRSLRHRVRAALAQPLGSRRTPEVIRTEEKGSDANLAMRLVREQHGKRIWLATPGTGRPSQQSRKHADFALHIRTNRMRHSQLPDPIPGTNIREPAAWQGDCLVRPVARAHRDLLKSRTRRTESVHGGGSD